MKNWLSKKNTFQFDQKDYIAHFLKKKKKKLPEMEVFFYEKFAKYKNTFQFDQKEYIAH